MTQPHGAPQAKEFMTRHVHTIPPEMPLDEIIRFLQKHEISNAPVVREEHGKPILVGFVSERECLEFLANESFFGSPAPRQTAASIMRKHPVCVQPETELFALASIFIEHGYRHLPVVENGELQGIVSRRDILKAMDHYYRHELQEQDRQKRPPNWRELISLRFIASAK